MIRFRLNDEQHKELFNFGMTVFLGLILAMLVANFILWMKMFGILGIHI